MFKFNFQVEEDGENPTNKEDQTEQTNKSDGELTEIEWYEAEKVIPNVEIVEQLDVFRLNAVDKQLGEVTISYAVSGFLLENVTNKANDDDEEEEEEDIVKAEKYHSDLLPGVYEGGAKIWECTDDLLAYMSVQFTIEDFQGKRVLDLGCGSGLLGIYAFKCGAFVNFQDYNLDVLRNITIPNVLLNIEVVDSMSAEEFQSLFKSVEFHSGDWQKYVQLTKTDDKFDIILSSETIYNPENQKKLINTFADKLSQEGRVLVAAKTHYFGVGGGLRQFEGVIGEDKRFNAKVVYFTQTEGVSREILLLTRNQENK